MSKNKKKVRNLKYISLRKEEQAPKIGSFIEEKDTLIAQKISDENVSLFMTDQNGKVMQAVGVQVSKPLSNVSPTLSEETILQFIKDNKFEIFQILASVSLGGVVRQVFINGIEGGFYYKMNGGDETFTEDAEIELMEGDYIELTRTGDGDEGFYFGSLGYTFVGGNNVIRFEDIDDRLEINFQKMI